MYELIQAGERTYYINCPAKIGIYKVSDTEVYLIDSGNDKEAGKKVLKILDQNKWRLLGIINTHSNADHIGGNNLLQERTGCKIISTEFENVFARFPILEPSFLYGGFPCKELKNKFLMAAACKNTCNIDESLPEGIEYIRFGGHYFDMIGLKTSDEIYFLADCVFGENIISKYHLSFIYDVKEFLNTLDLIENLNGKLYIPAHAEAVEDIKPLAEMNRKKVFEIINNILHICEKPICFEDVLKNVFDMYNLTMDFNQYVLVGSTIRSYLSYLHDEGKLECIFNGNRLLWKTMDK